MRAHQKRTIISIGGKEDKEGDRLILAEIARRIGRGRLLISAVASKDPDPLYEIYEGAFSDLGVKNTVRLDFRDRADASSPERLKAIQGAKGIFFTGGDQLRITSQLGGTPAFEKIKNLYEKGGLICGTSAGASVVCSTMLVSGTSRESYKIGDVKMGPGLGFLDWAIIDQHFAERGRMGRLLGAIAENPHTLGIGIDEDTAIVCEGNAGFYVIGDGAVSVVDGAWISYSNIAESEPKSTVSIYDLKIHVLSAGDGFRLSDRKPYKHRRRSLTAGSAPIKR